MRGRILMEKRFNALVVSENEENVVAQVTEWSVDQLSEGDTLIKVLYSAVNYKDALATIKKGGVVRNYPMIPGIDLTGEIIESADARFKAGDKVVVTGNGTGVSHTGGFSEVVRVPGNWVLPLPKDMTPKQGATLGTAGVTAVEAVQKLEMFGLKDNKDATILVTGATGGVGSVAIAFLHGLGYKNIVALSRKDNNDYLTALGVSRVVKPEEISFDKPRPLAKQQFDYVIDTIGGDMLTAILPQISYGGAIALCGNASGIKLSATVLPFILRGVSMLGVDSVQLSNDVKMGIWERLEKTLSEEVYDVISSREESLEASADVVKELLEGTHSGRTLIKM